jgi:hypothetical protein
MPRMNTNAMTWTALLGKWVEFAQASLALPHDAEGERWRQSVPAIIHLQAVTFALDELDQLPSSEQPYAHDMASVMIDDNVSTLESIWADAESPQSIKEVIADARDALKALSRSKPDDKQSNRSA